MKPVLEVGEYVSRELELRGHTATSFAQAVHDQLGYSVSSVVAYLRMCRNGYMYGTWVDRVSNPEGKLERLSLLLNLLETPADHPVIERIRSIDSRFVYPPKDDRYRQVVLHQHTGQPSTRYVGSGKQEGKRRNGQQPHLVHTRYQVPIKGESPIDSLKYIKPGMKVRIVGDGGKQYSFTIVESGGDPSTGTISVEAPLAKSLIGRMAGEEISVKAPRGILNFTIESIES